MDAMVSGRIPTEMKEQGSKLLAQIGATQSQLIKAAYEYLLAEGRLPQPQSRLAGPSALTEQDLTQLENFINATTFEVGPDFWADFDLKDTLAEGRWADYEALA